MFRYFIPLLILLLPACTQAEPQPSEQLKTEAQSSASTNSYHLTTFTDRYPHGALGDNLEPTELIETSADGTRITLVTLPENQVFETNRVILDDLTGDRSPELLVTVSDDQLGSANVIYDLQGNQIAQTEFIGTRFRWRHLIGVMENELGEKFVVDVVRPHLDATLTLYELQDNQLVPVFEESGYPSHEFGSEDLDLATISNKDGRDILRIPHQDGFEHFLYLEDKKLVLLDR